jgi:hypothetical protein
MVIITRVAKIPTASTGRLKWNVWMGIVIVVEGAKTKDFSANNTPMSPSSKQRKKVMDYELTRT